MVTLDDVISYGLSALSMGVLAATIGGAGLAFFAHPTSRNEKTVTILYNHVGEPRLALTGITNLAERVDRDVVIGISNGTTHVGSETRTGGVSFQVGLVNVSSADEYTGCIVQVGLINYITDDQYGRGERVYPLLNVRCAPEHEDR